MFAKIKRYFLRKYIRENRVNRQRQGSSLKHARSVGVLCEITNEDSYKSIYAIFSKLQMQDKNVRLVGYVNDKEVPFYCLPQLTCDFFSNKHLNWYGKPMMPQLLDFTKLEFDILIDFNYRDNAPIESLIALSKSKFIIGQNEGSASYYDLFINDSNKEYGHFLDAIFKYTSKLSGNE